MATERAKDLARRIGAEPGIKISYDDPVLALMVFQEQQIDKIAEDFKKYQIFFIKSLLEKLIIISKPKKTSKLITMLVIFNTLLTIVCVILGIDRFWTN